LLARGRPGADRGTWRPCPRRNRRGSQRGTTAAGDGRSDRPGTCSPADVVSGFSRTLTVRLNADTTYVDEMALTLGPSEQRLPPGDRQRALEPRRLGSGHLAAEGGQLVRSPA